jgi:ribosomal protein S18 acetylase RimI-like enzyme
MLGFCQLFPTFCSIVAAPICALYDLHVKPEARRSGAAAFLLLVADQYARQHGFVRMDLTTARTNFPAQSLYESLGWEGDEIFHAYSKKPQGHSGAQPRSLRSLDAAR